MSSRAELIAYFSKMRRRYAEKYLAAEYWWQRKEARAWVLHYGRLIRMLRP